MPGMIEATHIRASDESCQQQRCRNMLQSFAGQAKCPTRGLSKAKRVFNGNLFLNRTIGGTDHPSHVTRDAGSSFPLPNFFSFVSYLTNAIVKSFTKMSEHCKLGLGISKTDFELYKTTMR